MYHKEERNVSTAIQYKKCAQIFIFSVNKSLAFVPHRLSLIPLMNFVLLFEISMMEKLTKCSTMSRIITLVILCTPTPFFISYRVMKHVQSNRRRASTNK